MALDEMEIRDLDQVTRAYAALLSAHVRLLRILLPRTRWKEVPVVVVFEQNTYVNSLADVKDLLEHSLARSGFRVLFYSKWSQSNSRALEAALGASRGSGSSNRTGSTLDVHMYMRSRKGANLATDVAARVLEARDAITLPEDRLADKAHAEYGKRLLGKLRDEMAAVVITESSRGCGSVTTGGKRSVGGEYTRDDVLSAFLLLCHTRDEIHGGDRTVNVREGVYCT
ncbi:hypothetical protein Q5P01_000679 [Channa striata]|uniref:Uncharacterized protein n=1 Tax=Channa striata TaxID=64152 RepID=A0AA88IHC1_CHASR|nr:hypothetical protein Q5P01_000679 [Channa striata]